MTDDVVRAVTEDDLPRPWWTVENKLSVRPVEMNGSLGVAWRCIDGPPEWIGTGITFAFARDGGETTGAELQPIFRLIFAPAIPLAGSIESKRTRPVATVRPAESVTVASHTWVVRPRDNGRAAIRSVPARTAWRNDVLFSRPTTAWPCCLA